MNKAEFVTVDQIWEAFEDMPLWLKGYIVGIAIDRLNNEIENNNLQRPPDEHFATCAWAVVLANIPSFVTEWNDKVLSGALDGFEHAAVLQLRAVRATLDDARRLVNAS